MVKLLVGILNLSLAAKYFGVSLDKDIWLLALSVILFLDMAVWGPINETFRAKFIFLKGELGENKAVNKTRSLLFFSLIISAGLVFFVIIYPQFLAKIIAPTYSGEDYNKLIAMIKIVAPVLLITQFSAISTSILNAYDSFFVPEITGFITSVINLVLLIFLAPYVGIYSLVISYYIGAILLLLLLFVQIEKKKIPVFTGYTNVNFRDFKLFFLFALPFFLPYFFGQVSSVLEKTLVSTLGVGNVSSLDYSRKFTDIFLGVLTSVLATMLVPTLSSKFIEKKSNEFADEFMQMFQLGMLLLSFVIPVFTSSSLPIVLVFFDKGKIPQGTLLEISQLTIFYSWSTLAIFIYLIFGMALLSSNSEKKYAFFGVLAQIISILINLVFIKILGIFVFPVSLLLSHIISGIIMAYNFPYKSKTLILVFFKYTLILISTAVLVFYLSKFVNDQINPFFQIINNSILTIFLIFFFIYIFNLEEKKFIVKYYSKLRR